MEEILEKYKELIQSKIRLLEVLESIPSVKAPKKEPDVKAMNPDNQFLVDAFIKHRQAAASKHNIQLTAAYRKSIQGLQKYPLPIVHPDQALQLQGVGKSLIKSIYSAFIHTHKKFISLKKPTSPPTVPKPFNFSSFDKIINEIDQSLYVKDIKNIRVEVLLIADTRETDLIRTLIDENILHNVRSLGLGDFLWISSISYLKKSVSVHTEEFILDFIIERKTQNDLKSSNFSNHLRDQIRRLKTVDIPKKLLLTEGQIHSEILVESQLLHDLNIVHMRNSKSTVKFLSSLTTMLSSLVQLKTLHSIRKLPTFAHFQGLQKNSITVTEILSKQLREFPGMTAKKLALFTQVYPTPLSIIEGIEDIASFRENLTWCGVGEKLGQTIFLFFGGEESIVT